MKYLLFPLIITILTVNSLSSQTIIESLKSYVLNDCKVGGDNKHKCRDIYELTANIELLGTEMFELWINKPNEDTPYELSNISQKVNQVLSDLPKVIEKSDIKWNSWDEITIKLLSLDTDQLGWELVWVDYPKFPGEELTYVVCYTRIGRFDLGMSIQRTNKSYYETIERLNNKENQDDESTIIIIKDI